MAMRALEIRNLRCLNSVSWEPVEGCNFVLGANGAGKTSLLEAVSLLATARALRPGSAGAARRYGSTVLRIQGEIGTGLDQATIRYERDGRQRQWFFNDEAQHSPLTIYRRLPLLVFSPESHYAALREAMVRRAGIHWALFHVEPLFLETWRRYQRVLRQRNAALRHHDPTYRMFDPGLAQNGGVLAGFWQTLIATLGPRTSKYAAALGLPLTVTVSLRPGWSGPDLLTALRDGAASDAQVGYTQSGPHRADLAFGLDGHSLQHGGSHGQQKLVMSAWRLALAEAVASTGVSPLLLVDDLPAELDRTHRAALADLLAATGGQVFITATEWAEAVPAGAAVFHVEHGQLRAG